MNMRKRVDIEKDEEQLLAPYAMKSKDSRPRDYDEPSHEYRTCYQRDRDRVVHCEHFRKLEYKTQVFIIFEGDYYRTRLTHTLEVAQIARTIGRSLRLNEDLIEAIALAHDLGHPPFGHAGEEALNQIMSGGYSGTFNHNVRSFEIVTKYEKRYPNFDGLNLTPEVLVGILKHQSEYDLPGTCKKYRDINPSLEAQVVDFADSLAYLNHDIDDGLKAKCLFIEDLKDSALWQKAIDNIKNTININDLDMLRYQVVKQLIDMQIKNFLAATYQHLKDLDFKTSQDVQNFHEQVICFSPEMKKERDDLQELLNQKLYHHYRVVRMTSKAHRIINDLFKVYLDEPNQLPPSIYPREMAHDLKEKYETICNHIASMTDRFALDEHKKLFNPYTIV